MKISLINGVFDTIKDIFVGLFAILPQSIYFLYASLASLLDVFQFLIRKLVGLDTYYVENPSTGNLDEKAGDVLKEILEGIVGINQDYSSLAVVFWSMIIFGVIIALLSTIFAIIKAHYNYNAEKSHPMKIVWTGIKSILTMAITPIVIIFGLTLGQVLFVTIDSLTTVNSNDNIEGVFEQEAIDKFKTGFKTKTVQDEEGNYLNEVTDVCYSHFDMFAISEPTNTQSFSGILFEIMAMNSNRVRNDKYTASDAITNNQWATLEVFYTSSNDDKQETVAYQIDYAFANSLQLKDKQKIYFEEDTQADDEMGYSLYMPLSAPFLAGVRNVSEFSKFNVGLVWYYYNLWSVNFLLGYAGGITMLTILTSIIFGLFKRLIICGALFLVQAPLAGLAPLDEGNAFSSWRKEFLKYFISGYSTIIGMNLFFLIIPVLMDIKFFKDKFPNMIFVFILLLAGLLAVKKFISMVCSFVGGADLNAEGESVKSGVGDLATKAGTATAVAGRVGVGMFNYAMRGGAYASGFRKISGSVPSKPPGKFKKATNWTKFKIKNSSKKVKRGVYTFAGTEIGSALLGMFALGDASQSTKYKDEVFERDDKGELVLDGNRKPNKLTGKEARNQQRRERGKAVLKNGMIDLTGTVLKAFGEATGIQKGINKAKDGGLQDEFKMFAQEAFGSVGVGGVGSKASAGQGMLATAKQKEKASEKADKEMMESVAEKNNATRQAISSLREVNRKLR